MDKIQRISSGAKWEKIVSYSRVVRVGSLIEVSGTVAYDENGVVGANDVGAQTTYILEKIEHYLKKVGATRKDVIRTRIYVTDINKWEAVGRAHGIFFQGINPATAMVEVSGLISPEYLVEIEVTAVASE
jgi:enamine deaminase RidA (YjgF/YER057c/UK114 family)